MELGRQVKASTTRKIEQWLVVYNYDLFTDGGFDHQVWEYTNIPDVITFWTWQSFHLKVLREHLSYVRAKCPGKKLNLGVYLWDFSTGKPLTDEWMKLQLDSTLAEFRAGLLDSISLCASCLMGLGIKAENDFRRWLDKYGDEEVPNQVILPAENAVNNDRV